MLGLVYLTALSARYTAFYFCEYKSDMGHYFV